MTYISGIYAITNLINNKIYIGSAINIKNRWREHKYELSKNKHHSIALQRAYNKYGIENFKYSILFYCSKEALIFYEQRTIDKYKPEYNICKIAGSRLGLTQSAEARAKVAAAQTGNKNNLGKIRTKETRAKTSNSLKGHKHSEETKSKMAESFRKRCDRSN